MRRPPPAQKDSGPPAGDGPSRGQASLVTIDDAHAGQRIDNFLLGKLKGVPKSHVYRILRSGEVRVNKGRVDQTYRLCLGDNVRLPPLRENDTAQGGKSFTDGRFGGKSAEKARGTLSFSFGVIFEDDALVAINKPSGVAVHGGSGISAGVIETMRAQRPDARFLELVHRLDRETSGVLLLAKKRSALTGMHALLRGEGMDGAPAERVQKHYLAMVKGAWPHKRKDVRTRLSKFVTASGERRVAADEDDGQESHTIFTRLQTFQRDAQAWTLLDCDIRTGRTHQIRVHLATLGFPIIGDDKYGDFALNKTVAANRNGGLKRMFLHAREMRFLHPLTGQRMEITAPLPSDLERFVAFVSETVSLGD